MLKINRQLFLYFITITISVIGVLSCQKNYYQNYLSVQNKVDYQQEEQQLKIEANLQKNLPSLGFSNLIADWAFLKYIQYFGDTEAREQTGYSLITDYFETIVNQDPKFIQAHLSLSTANSIFAGKPQATVALLNKSLKSLKPEMSPHPFLVLAYKAVDEILFLGDLKAARNSYLEAASWAELSKEPSANIIAQRYRDTAAFLATNPDSTTTQISGWQIILSNNQDPKVQKYALQKIQDLGGEIAISEDGKITIKPPKKDV